MDIEQPLRLLGPVNCEALCTAVLAQSAEAWLAQAHRQNNYEVHKQTQSLVLVFCDGQMDALTVTREPAWETLAEQAVRRFEEEVSEIGVVDLSRETARHAQVEQRDQRLEIDRDKIELEKQRIELAKAQAAFQNDRFQIAAETWRFTLGWFVNEEPDIADRLASRSEEFLIQLEESIATT